MRSVSHYRSILCELDIFLNFLADKVDNVSIRDRKILRYQYLHLIQSFLAIFASLTRRSGYGLTGNALR